MALEPEGRDGSPYSRRQFLQKTIGGAAVLGLGACGSSSSSSTTTTSPSASAGKPKRGGTFRFVSTGGGSSDTLDANNCVENLDFARAPQLYDCLMYFDANNTVQLQLADEVTPNADATEWTIRVKQGIEFHNGKTLTIEDVLFTFNRILKNNYSGASGLASRSRCTPATPSCRCPSSATAR
jgi:peptide/nickel transport system substrate-binding protein